MNEEEASHHREDTAEAGQPGDSEVNEIGECAPRTFLCLKQRHIKNGHILTES